MAERRKHFNRATVYGSLLKTPEILYTQAGKEYCSFLLQCPNDLHGNVRVYGKIWGDRATQFVGEAKAGTKLRLEGVLQQYQNEEDQTITNFVFFNWRPCTEKESRELRAVFILVGRVESVDPAAGEEGADPVHWEVALGFEQEATEERQARAETYFFRAEKLGALGISEALEEKTVQLSGVLEQPEDYFGNKQPTRPMIKELKIVSEELERKGTAKVEGDDEVPF